MDWQHVQYNVLEAKYAARLRSSPGFKADYALWPPNSNPYQWARAILFAAGLYGTERPRSVADEHDCEKVRKHGWKYFQTGENFKEYEGNGSNGQCQPEVMSYLGYCTPPQELDATTYTCRSGESIRMRLINSAAGIPMAVWVDNHNLTVVARDGHDVVPQKVRQVLLAIGQRIDVILDCNQDENFAYKLFAALSEAWYPGCAKNMPDCEKNYF